MSKSSSSGGSYIGTLIFCAGALLGGYAFFMDTSVTVKYPGGNSFGLPERVNNIGLMNDKQTYLIVSGILIIAGLAYIFFTPKKDTVEKIAEKKCPLCAELIKAEAKKCRFCNHLFEENQLSSSDRL